jgi:hypothetical protein
MAALALAAAGMLLMTAGQAFADSGALTVTDGTGKSDPAAGLPRVFTVTGNASTAEELFLKFRPAGGAPCAPSYDTDSGESLIGGRDVNGNYSEQTTYTMSDAGTYTFCIWLADYSSAVSSPITQTIAFRRPTGSITASFSPVTPRPNRPFTISVSGSAEAPTEAFAALQPAGAACAPTFDTDPGESLVSGQDVNGAFSFQVTDSGEKAGNYTLCLWLADFSSDPNPTAGPQPEPLSIVAPPRRCVVPKLPHNRRLSTVKRRIRAAHCKVGAIRFSRHTHVRRGRVVRLSPRSGRRLAHNALVSIVVSRRRR